MGVKIANPHLDYGVLLGRLDTEIAKGLLVPPLHRKADIKDLERLWLDATCAYDQLDRNIMADHDWDALTVELREREAEWSPYFFHAVPRECIVSSTSSGIGWHKDLPLIVVNGLREEGWKRLKWWKQYLHDRYVKDPYWGRK